MQSGGVDIGQVLQLFIERVGRAATPDVFDRFPQAPDEVVIMSPPGQAIEPVQQAVAIVNRRSSPARAGHRLQEGFGKARVLAEDVGQLQGQCGQPDEKHRRGYVFDRMTGEIALDELSGQQLRVYQPVKPGRCQASPEDG